MDEIKNLMKEVKEFLLTEKLETIKKYHSLEEIEKMKGIVKKLKNIRDLNQYEDVISSMELEAIIITFDEELLKHGIYQGKDVSFKHDINLNQNYSFDANIKIVDETTGNEITINFMDILHFSHLITEITKENIYSEDRILHPENYERKQISKGIMERSLPMPKSISDERSREISETNMITCRHLFR